MDNSNLIAFKPTKLSPAFAKYTVDTSLGDGIVGGFSVINYRGKTWSLRHQGQNYPFVREDDNTPLSYIDVIIVSANPNLSKTYYGDEPWDENSAGAPLCAAVNGIAPDADTPEPQSSSCAICKHNEWRTLPNGKRAKECQDQKRLAVLLMPTMTTKMLGSPLLEPVFLKIPPASLAPLKTYNETLAHQGLPFFTVVTRISFSSDKTFQMMFKAVQQLSDLEAPLVEPLLDDPQTKRITGVMPTGMREIPRETGRIETGLAAAFNRNAEQQQAKVIEQFAAVPVGQKVNIRTKPVQIVEPEPEQPVKRGRGRPAKPKPAPEPEEEVEEVAQEDTQEAAAMRASYARTGKEISQDAKEPTASWEDIDSGLDSDMEKHLAKKVLGMLK